MGRNKQTGVALLVVLLIVAIIAALAVDITGRNQLAMRRTLNLAQYDQAYWYAMSAEQLAEKVLRQDMKDADNTVHLQQYWAQADVIFPADEGEIGGNISDMRSCFNLNALSQPATEDEKTGQLKMPLAVRQFKALLVALGMDDFAAESLSQTLKDYLDEDTVTSPFGAEDAEYESRTVPYRAANTLMNDKSELRAVMGFTQQIYKVLDPYICVIPGNNQQVLNVNTLAPEHAALLAGMLDNKVSVGEAESLLNQRPAAGYAKVEDFWTAANLDSNLDAQLKSSIGVDSKYFLLQAAAKVDTAVFRMDSVLQNNNGQFRVIARQFGGQNKTEQHKPKVDSARG